MLLLGLTTLLIAVPLSNWESTNQATEGDQRPNLDEGNQSTNLGQRTEGTEPKQTESLFENKLYSPLITPTLLTRVTSVILLYCAALALSSLYLQAIGSGLGLYSGLIHVTTVTQLIEAFLYVIGALILLGTTNSTPSFFALSSLPVIKRRGKENMVAEYPLVILFTTLGASFLISSADLVSMYLSIELQSFAVYILAAIYRNSEAATSAGLKYFLLGALSSALILLGSSLIYAYTGLTQFEGISMMADLGTHAVRTNLGGPRDTNSSNIALGVIVIGVGFLFKVSAAPFHN